MGALVKRIAVKTVWQKVDEVRSQMTICTAAPRQQDSRSSISCTANSSPAKPVLTSAGLIAEICLGSVASVDCVFVRRKPAKLHTCRHPSSSDMIAVMVLSWRLVGHTHTLTAL